VIIIRGGLAGNLIELPAGNQVRTSVGLVHKPKEAADAILLRNRPKRKDLSGMCDR
jgi:hypothetical protein